MSSISRCQSGLMQTVIQVSSTQLPNGVLLELEENRSRLMLSRTRLIKMRGLSGPLSFPKPCASENTAPARCGEDAAALQRYITRQGRRAQGRLKTKPLGPKFVAGSSFDKRMHQFPSGAKPTPELRSAVLQGTRRICGGASVPGPMLQAAPSMPNSAGSPSALFAKSWGSKYAKFSKSKARSKNCKKRKMQPRSSTVNEAKGIGSGNLLPTSSRAACQCADATRPKLRISFAARLDHTCN